MPRIGLKDLPFPDRLDDRSMLSNLRTAWENFKTIDRFKTVSVTAAGTTVLTAISQTVFANAAAGNVALTVPSASGNTGIILRIFKTDSTTNTVTIDGNVLGGNAGQSRLILESDGANWRIAELYDEGFFTATLTGVTATITGTAYFVRIGKSVTLRLPSLIGTSNTNAMTITGMPTQIRPSVSLNCYINMETRDNGTDKLLSMLTIATSGVISPAFASSVTGFYGTIYTSSSSKGIVGGTIHYTLQ